MLAEPGAEALAGARQSFQPRAGGASRVFHIPHPFIRNFIGRDDTLALLRQQLDEQRLVALWALGGSGKTQTASRSPSRSCGAPWRFVSGRWVRSIPI